MPDYPQPRQFIAGEWQHAHRGSAAVVTNPATGEFLAEVPRATIQDLDDALEASDRAFHAWRAKSAAERASILKRSGELLRERALALAKEMTLEQGKTINEAEGEFRFAGEVFEWNAFEGMRAYGRVIPARVPNSRQMVLTEPIGPVAAFTPWNFPAGIPARKIASALAAGCTMVLKPSEETPASAMAIAQALADAGLPDGVFNVVFGMPSEVSSHLIGSPIVRKVHFTGSTAVGRHLALLAAQGPKPCTLELGGHAPVLVFDDANLDQAVVTCLAGKIRNSGQVCTSPTRFLIQDGIYDAFVKRFGEALDGVAVGSGLDRNNQMGALANSRRLEAMEELTSDAIRCGGKLVSGGMRGGDKGYFWRPSLVADVPGTAKAMHTEPFGPLAFARRFSSLEEGIAEANSLPYGLAAYAFTQSAATATIVANELQAGGVGINTFTLSAPEAPFCGVKDSGYGVEGGPEGIQAFMHTKFVNHVL